MQVTGSKHSGYRVKGFSWKKKTETRVTWERTAKPENTKCPYPQLKPDPRTLILGSSKNDVTGTDFSTLSRATHHGHMKQVSWKLLNGEKNESRTHFRACTQQQDVRIPSSESAPL